MPQVITKSGKILVVLDYPILSAHPAQVFTNGFLDEMALCFMLLWDRHSNQHARVQTELSPLLHHQSSQRWRFYMRWSQKATVSSEEIWKSCIWAQDRYAHTWKIKK